MKKIQIGETLTGNLKEGTWTFEIEGDMELKAGKFAIIEITNLSLIQLTNLENFINAL